MNLVNSHMYQEKDFDSPIILFFKKLLHSSFTISIIEKTSLAKIIFFLTFFHPHLLFQSLKKTSFTISIMKKTSLA